jgi:hypothetical protein
MKRLGIAAVACCAFILALSGCAQLDIKEPLDEFSKATNAATTTLSSYYTSLNDYERDLYLEERALNPELRVEETDAQGKPTPLLTKAFPQESIDLRINLFDQIATYCTRLGELAGSDAPERFSANMKTLGDNLTTLRNDLDRAPATTDPTAKNYIGPITALIGVVGSMALEAKRNEETRKAILDGEKPVMQIIDFLKKDFSEIILPLRQTGDRLLLARMVQAYNRADRTKMSYAERRAALDRIDAQITVVNTFGNPVTVLDKMAKAYQALAAAAKPGSKPADFAEAVSRLDDYVNQVKKLIDAIQAVRNVKKEG